MRGGTIVDLRVDPSGSLHEPRRFCYRCHKSAATCICGVISTVANRTGITILQHPHERFHAIGSVRIARLGLERVRVKECIPWRPDQAALSEVSADAALLYPGPSAERLDRIPVGERPRELVILDGTWFHAKKIYDALPGLRAMRTVVIEPTQPSNYRIRREPKAGYLATIEAIVEALRILEPDTEGIETLLDAFRSMIDRQLTFMD